MASLYREAKKQTNSKQEGKQKRQKVGEITLKKRNIGAHRVQKRLPGRVINKSQKLPLRTTFKRAEEFIKEFKRKEQDTIRIRKLSKEKVKQQIDEPEGKIAIVVRISDTNDINHKTRAILRLFRLRQIQDATFIELNRSTIKMLKLIEPHIAWGIPNLKTVRLMIFKRGFANINRQRVSLSDNRVIEENLKDFGILCIEDLVHEIYNVGNNFKIVNNFLWPFKLNSPNRNYRKKKHSQFGFADENINKFIQSLI